MLAEISSKIASPETAKINASARLKKACTDFESIFINQMLKASDTGIGGDSGFLKGNDGKIIKSMFNEKLAGTMSSGGGIGLGEILFEQLKS